MEEKRRRGFFFSKGMKALTVCICLLSISIFAVVIGLLSDLMQNGVEWDKIVDGGDTAYEETAKCGSDAVQFLHNLPGSVELGAPFTTDGELNAGKKVDITNLTGSGKKNKNTTYTVSDIMQMEEDGVIDQLDELLMEIRDNYYSQMDGADQAYTEEIPAEGGTETASEETEEEAQWQYSQAFTELYTRGKDLETNLPQSGISLAEYAKENPKDISLFDLYTNLVNAAEQLESYQWLASSLEEKSNLMYVVENTDTGEVYTNFSGWKDGYSAESVVSYDKTMFFRGVRQDGKWTETEAVTDAENFIKRYFDGMRITGDNEEIVILLDTEYPAEDGFYDSKMCYERYAKWGKTLLACAVISSLLVIVTVIMLTVQAGRIRGDRELHKGIGDGIPTEVMLAAIMLALGLMLSIGVAYMDYGSGRDLFLIALIGVGELLMGAIFLPAYTSVVRRLKAKNMWKSSLCYAIVQSGKKVYMARQTSGRMIISFCILMLGNIFSVMAMRSFGVLLALTADGLVLLYLVRERAGHQVIRDGLARIASGELDFKIDAGELIGDNREMAEAVNHVGDGLQNAVKETLKSERLKADLITNVSHDIKTPLTSIINYVDLLKREDIQDEKIKSYIDVLDSKSQRLKQLTEDLVEASKISSGNVVLDMQPIRLGELVWQTSGECEEKFAARNLELVCRLPDQRGRGMAVGRTAWITLPMW